MGVSIWEGSKAAAVAESLDTTDAHLAVIARALAGGSNGKIESHTMAQAIVRSGDAKLYFAPGDLYKVNKQSGVSVSYSSDTITGVTVDGDTFISAVGSAETHGYEFIYDGNVWRMEGNTAELVTYGVAVTGTPAADDVIVVHVQGSVVYFEVLDTDDFDVPVNPNLTHTLPLLSRDILTYNAIPFCQRQLLKAIAADEFPDGLPAGTYNFGLDHAAYNNSTAQDGSVSFTTTQTIPVGGGIRHTSIGYNSSPQNRDAVLNGTFITYDADGNTIESNIATVDGASGTNLGTATAVNAQYMSGTHLNYTRRQSTGSNYPLGSYIRMWLRSSAPGAESGQTASWYTKVTEFDIPIKSTRPGFRYGLDPDFDAAICPVRKRTYLPAPDRTGTEKYIDSEETIWQISLTELGFGANDSIYECGVKADGTINRADAYALYKDSTDADKIKYDGTTAKMWYLRSPVSGTSGRMQSIRPDGTLGYQDARMSVGAVCGVCIG